MGALSLRHGTRPTASQENIPWGAAAASQENTPWDATTLQQEGTWGRNDATAGRAFGRGGNAAGDVSGGAAWATRSRTNTRAGQKRRLWPRIGRESGVRMKKPDLLQFSPGSRNRVKVSTALNRHYTEGPDGYTRRVLLKLQQIAIRCIRQRDPAARQSKTSTRQHGAGVRQRAAARLPA